MFFKELGGDRHRNPHLAFPTQHSETKQHICLLHTTCQHSATSFFFSSSSSKYHLLVQTWWSICSSIRTDLTFVLCRVGCPCQFHSQYEWKLPWSSLSQVALQRSMFRTLYRNPANVWLTNRSSHSASTRWMKMKRLAIGPASLGLRFRKEPFRIWLWCFQCSVTKSKTLWHTLHSTLPSKSNWKRNLRGRLISHDFTPTESCFQ